MMEELFSNKFIDSTVGIAYLGFFGILFLVIAFFSVKVLHKVAIFFFGPLVYVFYVFAAIVIIGVIQGMPYFIEHGYVNFNR